MSEIIVWRGWIAAPEETRAELESLGITLGKRGTDAWEGCTVPDDALTAIDGRWGEWSWGLHFAKAEGPNRGEPNS